MKRSYPRQIGRLLLGLLVSATGIVMMLQANIGLDPWNVLHQGLADVIGISFGQATILVGAGAILLSLLLGERIGLGTVLNIGLTGLVIDQILLLGLIPQQTAFLPGLLMLLVGLEVLTLGTWLYMSACLGTGPRDALTVGISRKTRLSVGICRGAIELLVTLTGWVLGGSVGVGTVVSAVGIGALFQLNFSLLHFKPETLHQENLAETWRLLRGRFARKP